MNNHLSNKNSYRPLNFILILSLFTLLWTGSGFSASARAAADDQPPFSAGNPPIQSGSPALPTNQIILRYRPATAAYRNPAQAQQMDRLSAKAGIGLSFQRAMSGEAVVLRLPQRLPADQVQALADRLAALPEVESAEPDGMLQPTLTPNDTYYYLQWGLSGATAGINAPAAWDLTTGSASVVVAVIDTGITSHPEFNGRTVAGYDFISDSLMANDGNGRDNNPSDPGDWITTAESQSGYFQGCLVQDSTWHGTFTAGEIGATGNNSAGVAGVNWSSKILPVRVLGKCGGYLSDIIDGMRWSAGLAVSGVPANANPAKVLNLSLGGAGSCSSNMQSAVNDVLAAGAVVVVSAGNASADVSGTQPANCSGVVAVAALADNGSRASYSNYGAGITISAPGGDTGSLIASTTNTGTTSPASAWYGYMGGTSMAAPFVSGTASLMFSINPSLTPAQVKQVIRDTARAFPAGSTCNTSICGGGMLDAGAAVNASIPPTFADVPFDYTVAYGGVEYQLHDYIQALYDAGLTAGCATDPLRFCPNNTLTRVESAVFMLRGVMGLSYAPPTDPAGYVFGDDWSSSLISWGRPWAEGMWDKGMTAGCSADPLLFCPTNVLTRAEAAVFGLHIEYGMSYTPPAASHIFGDDWSSPTISWAEPWAEKAYLDGLLPGCGMSGDKPLFCPGDLVTRAWAAYLIVGAKNLPVTP